MTYRSYLLPQLRDIQAGQKMNEVSVRTSFWRGQSTWGNKPILGWPGSQLADIRIIQQFFHGLSIFLVACQRLYRTLWHTSAHSFSPPTSWMINGISTFRSKPGENIFSFLICVCACVTIERRDASRCCRAVFYYLSASIPREPAWGAFLPNCCCQLSNIEIPACARTEDGTRRNGRSKAAETGKWITSEGGRDFLSWSK